MLFNNKLAVLAILTCLIRTEAANFENLPEAMDTSIVTAPSHDAGSNFNKKISETHDPSIIQSLIKREQIRTDPIGSKVRETVKDEYNEIFKFIYQTTKSKLLIDRQDNTIIIDESNSQADFVQKLLEDIEKEGVDVIVTKGTRIINEDDPSDAYFVLLEEALKRRKLEAFKMILSLFDPTNFIFNRSIAAESNAEGKFRPFKILPAIAKVTHVVTKRVVDRKGISKNIGQKGHSRYAVVDMLLDSMLEYLIQSDFTENQLDFIRYILDDFKFVSQPDYLKYLKMAYESKTSYDLIEYFLPRAVSSSQVELLNLAAHYEDVRAFFFLIEHFKLSNFDPKVLNSIEYAFTLDKWAFLNELHEKKFNLHALIKFSVMHSNQKLLDSIVSNGVPTDTLTVNLGNVLYKALEMNNQNAFLSLIDSVGTRSKEELFRLLMVTEYNKFKLIMQESYGKFSKELIDDFVEYLKSNKRLEKAEYITKTLIQGESTVDSENESSVDEIERLLEATYMNKRGRSISRNSRSSSRNQSFSTSRSISPIRKRSIGVDAEKSPYKNKN